MKNPFAALHKRRRHNLSYLVGILSGVLTVLLLSLPRNDILHARGPLNSGHEDMRCSACHKFQQGLLRQQLQANVQYLFGNRETSVSIGFRPVTNEDCLRCHERPKDRHPVYRFFEPRYLKVQTNLAPHQCVSCHNEHTGKRVTSNQTICSHCHKKLKMRNDPLDIPHSTLVKDKKWETCLQCHDFHGNYKMKKIIKQADMIKLKNIKAYFNGEQSPYSKHKYYKAKKDS